MVARVRMLSAPRHMFGICVVGGAPRAETRSPTSVRSTPDSGCLCGPVSIENTSDDGIVQAKGASFLYQGVECYVKRTSGCALQLLAALRLNIDF